MGIDPEKLLVLFVIALIVLGPERLPGMARSLGRGLAEVRKYTSAARAEMDQVLAEPRSVVQSALRETDLEGLSELTNMRNPMRYIEAVSQPNVAQPTSSQPGGPQAAMEGASAGNRSTGDGSTGDGPEWTEPWLAAEASTLPLPDDPSLN
ncbi:MAG: twin-arginine translocase TatA/TatE family subunit [Actinobacteria bacterium]|nr:twin-arginine translocase TatA/TatE family subunit [Actinomycetota bacterium]